MRQGFLRVSTVLCRTTLLGEMHETGSLSDSKRKSRCNDRNMFLFSIRISLRLSLISIMFLYSDLCYCSFFLGTSRIGDNKKVSQIEMLPDEQLLVLISGDLS